MVASCGNVMENQADEHCLESQPILVPVVMHEKRAYVKSVQIVCFPSFLDS